MKINFFAPINNLGYGIHSYNTMRAMDALGHELVLIPPFGQTAYADQHIETWFGRRVEFSSKNPSIMIFHEEYLAQFSGQPRIGFPVFETERFNPVQIQMMKDCDYLFTPSEWARHVLILNGACHSSRIFVVPEGFDPDIFRVREKSISEESGEPFTFVHVGKFEDRKGTLQIVQAFFDALENERARLVLHVHNPFIQSYDGLNRIIQKLGFISTNAGETWRRLGLSIHITQPVQLHSQMPGFYQQADFGLFASRAEGWCLPLLEMLASGIPCIAPSWTGPSEYMASAPSHRYHITAGKKERVSGQFLQGERGEWQVPHDADMVNWIRSAYDGGREYRKSSEWKAATEHYRSFTWQSAAQKMDSALKEIC